MSITGSQLVQDALAACGHYGVGDNLGAADAQLVLRRLNRMLDSWGNDANTMYQIAVDTLTMSAGTASYATSLLASTLRPASIDSWYVTLDSVDYPGAIIDNQTYSDIPFKTAEGIPRLLYPAAGATSWTLYFYPTPDDAYTLNLSVRRPLNSTAITLNTTFAGPPGYEKALVDNLAVDIAPSFGRQPDPATFASARAALYLMKRANYQPLVMETDLPTRGRSNILTDNA